MEALFITPLASQNGFRTIVGSCASPHLFLSRKTFSFKTKLHFYHLPYPSGKVFDGTGASILSIIRNQNAGQKNRETSFQKTVGTCMEFILHHYYKCTRSILV